MHRTRKALATLAGAGFIVAGATSVHAERGHDEGPKAVPAESDADANDVVVQLTSADIWLSQHSDANSGDNFAGNFTHQYNDADQTADEDANGGSAHSDADADEAEVSAASVSGAAASSLEPAADANGWRGWHRRWHQRRRRHQRCGRATRSPPVRPSLATRWRVA